MLSDVPGEVSSLHAEYYYFPGPEEYQECFRAGLRISWTSPRDGSPFSLSSSQPIPACLSQSHFPCPSSFFILCVELKRLNRSINAYQ